MPPDKKLEKLEKLLEILDDSLTREEFVKAFEAVMEVVKKIESKNDEEVEIMKSSMMKLSEKMKEDIEMDTTEMRNMVKTEIEKMMKDHEKEMNFIYDKVSEMRKFHEKESQKNIEKMEGEIEQKMADRMAQMKMEMPDMSKMHEEMEEMCKPEALRDKLETLEGDERLDKTAIKGLEEEIEKLRKEIALSKGGVRRVYQPYSDDLSGSTNGTAKTFYLSREPLRTNNVTVFGTDFPVILRPTIDFSISGKTLTLTSAIAAPSSGATLICNYFA